MKKIIFLIIASQIFSTSMAAQGLIMEWQSPENIRPVSLSLPPIQLNWTQGDWNGDGHMDIATFSKGSGDQPKSMAGIQDMATLSIIGSMTICCGDRQ